MRLKLFIDNDWTDPSSATWFTTFDPSTGAPLAKVAEASAADVDRAVKAAKAAFDSGSWSEADPDERADAMLRAAAILKRRSDEFAEWEARDVGKPIAEARTVDIPYSIRALEYFANQAREVRGSTIPLPGNVAFDWTSYEPHGVVACVTPWNFPLHLATRCVCPAIATGNTVVLKPSSLAPVTSVMFGEILREAGVPAGVVNVVTGPGGSTGEALLSHPDVRMISLTGSVAAGRRALELSARSPIIKKVLLELGGKGAFIAEPDCDIDGAVDSLIVGFCLMQGEVCCASTRLYLHEGIYSAFMRKLVGRCNSIRLGSLMDPETQMGSLISREQLEAVHGYVQAALKAGARLACGGEPYVEPPCHEGAYYRPTVVEGVTNEMACCQEEIFGPVLVVVPYRDIDDAIAMANDNAYALGATVWSNDPRTLYWASRQLDAGMVWLNTNVFSRIEAPYGGNKNSGIGREDGRVGLLEYLRVKNNVLFVGRRYDNPYGFEHYD